MGLSFLPIHMALAVFARVANRHERFTTQLAQASRRVPGHEFVFGRNTGTTHIHTHTRLEYIWHKHTVVDAVSRGSDYPL